MSLIDINKPQTLDNIRDTVSLLASIDYDGISERGQMGVHILLAQILEALNWIEEQEAKQ